MDCEICKNVNHKYLSYDMTENLYTHQDCFTCKEKVYICCECTANLNSSQESMLRKCNSCEEKDRKN